MIDGWYEVEEYVGSGMKLVAEYVKEPGTRVRIMPWKSYVGAGFPDCHQVKLWVDGEYQGVRGCTPSVAESKSQAKEIAKEMMESV